MTILTLILINRGGDRSNRYSNNLFGDFKPFLLN